MREKFGLSPGQQLQVIALPGRIELVPSQSPVALRGFLQGGHVVDLASTLAIAAAQLSHAYRLPMAGCTRWLTTSAASVGCWVDQVATSRRDPNRFAQD